MAADCLRFELFDSPIDLIAMKCHLKSKFKIFSRDYKFILPDEKITAPAGSTWRLAAFSLTTVEVLYLSLQMSALDC